MKTEYKKYRIIYTFKHSKMGFNNGSRLGEVGDFENETLKLLLNLN
jgi:hypothetical protein